MTGSDETDLDEVSPEIVHWYPPRRRSSSLIGSESSGPLALNRAAIGATAVGALALGALAIGALAIGALAIGRLGVGRARIKELRIGHLIVDRVDVADWGRR